MAPLEAVAVGVLEHVGGLLGRALDLLVIVLGLRDALLGKLAEGGRHFHFRHFELRHLELGHVEFGHVEFGHLEERTR